MLHLSLDLLFFKKILKKCSENAYWSNVKFFGKIDNLVEKYFDILVGGVFMVCANVIMV